MVSPMRFSPLMPRIRWCKDREFSVMCILCFERFFRKIIAEFD